MKEQTQLPERMKAFETIKNPKNGVTAKRVTGTEPNYNPFPGQVDITGKPTGYKVKVPEEPEVFVREKWRVKHYFEHA